MSQELCWMVSRASICRVSFFFNDTATTEIYTLSLHDALPISLRHPGVPRSRAGEWRGTAADAARSEEHTSELQSQSNLVCRLLLEKKKNNPVSLHLCGPPRGPSAPTLPRLLTCPCSVATRSCT